MSAAFPRAARSKELAAWHGALNLSVNFFIPEVS